MRRIHPAYVFIIAIMMFLPGCQNQSLSESKGKLFIIGGGNRSQELVNAMISLSEMAKSGYAVVLPYSSEEPGEASSYISEQLHTGGVSQVYTVYAPSDSILRPSQLDTIRNAALIYITGGDQNKFMALAKKNDLIRIIRSAWQDGSMIAGTSAGAAVMSKKMITGNSLLYPDYTGDFPSIEANNIETTEGLGLLSTTIIDQHFIKRQRMNRLISVALENPGYQCIGIDESTALYVYNGIATIYGENQIIAMINEQGSTVSKHGLLGGKLDHISILLPGESFPLN